MGCRKWCEELLETFFFLRAKLGDIWKKLGMESLPGGQSCHQVFMLLILLSLSVLLKWFRDFLHLFCTVYASLLFLIERKSLNHFNKTDKLNKISSIKTWWQDWPPGSESMPNFFRMSPSFARRKKIKVSNNSSCHFLQPTVLRILKNWLFWPWGFPSKH